MKYMLLIYGNEEAFGSVGSETFAEIVRETDALNQELFESGELVGEATRRHRHQPPSGILRPPLHRPLGRGRHQRLLDGVLAGVEVAVAAHQRTEHLRDQPPDGPPVGHGSTLASYMSGRTSTPQ